MNSTHESMHHGDRASTVGGRGLEQVIDGLDRRLDELTERQRITRLVTLGGSVLLLGLMGLFGLSLYSTLQRQLNATQLQNAFMAKIDEIAPPLSQKFLDSALDAAPAYGEMAAARFEKVRPRLETMLVGEADKFSQQLQAILLAKTEAGMQRVTDRLSQDLKTRLPAVTEKKLDAIENTLRESLIVEGGGRASRSRSSRRSPRRRRVFRARRRAPFAARSPQRNSSSFYIIRSPYSKA